MRRTQMVTTVKGNFSSTIPKGITPSIKVGDVVPKATLAQIRREEMTRQKLNISDPSGIRAFIDQPIVEGTFPMDMEERKTVLSRLIHEYRNANPNVIHAAGIVVPTKGGDEVAYLTDIYFKCQSAFAAMIEQLKEQEILPITPNLNSLVWENIGFPRLATNLHLLRAVALYIEQENNNALIIHVLFFYAHGPAIVFSTRHLL